MSKQVVRIFLSFALVVAVVLSSMAAVFLVSVEHNRRLWVRSVFDEYLQSFTTKLKAELADPTERPFTVEQILLSSLNDRISGLYLRNPAGSAVVAWGATAGGDLLTLPQGLRRARTTVLESRLVPAQGEAGFTSKVMRCDLYEVEITASGPLYTIEVGRRHRPLRQKITLPPQVKATDIAGSLAITYNGESLGSVDVLTYTPSTYKGTGPLFRGLLSSFLVSLPVALVIALIMAASLSRRSQRYTDAIQRALLTLAEGEGEITLLSTKIREQQVINEAILHLESNLSLNRASRQAWLRAISHDLNTPVAAMKLIIDGIADKVFSPTDDLIAGLQQQTDQLAQKIAAVALYATLQSPEAKAEVDELDSDLFIADVLAAFKVDERARLFIDRAEAHLVGDKELLTTAVVQLLKNAFAATAESVACKLSDNQVVVTNPGQVDPTIDFFEPWSRGDSARHEPGVGLGLPIVSQVMRLHGGSASIEQVDGAVVVTLRWPGSSGSYRSLGQ